MTTNRAFAETTIAGRTPLDRAFFEMARAIEQLTTTVGWARESDDELARRRPELESCRTRFVGLAQTLAPLDQQASELCARYGRLCAQLVEIAGG